MVQHLGLASAAILGLASINQVQAAPPPSEACRNWFEQAWSDADSIPKLDTLGFKFRVDKVFIPPEPELQALREAIKGHPDHPARDKLPQYERARSGSPDASVFTVWRRGPAEWRINEDYIGWMPIKFQDECVTGEHAWGLNPRQLTLVDPKRAYPEGHEFNATEPRVMQDMLFLLTGGLHVAKQFKCVPAEFSCSRSTWEVRLIGEHITFTARGRWDAEADRGFVDELKSVAAPGAPSEVGTKYVSDSWSELAELTHWTAANVTEVSPSGVPRRVIRFVELETPPVGGFDALVAKPSPQHPDAIRGDPTFVGVHDFSGASSRMFAKVEDVWKTIPGAAGSSNEERLRDMGWWMLGLVTVGLVSVKVRRMLKAMPGV